jgi:hypothetical protein
MLRAVLFAVMFVVVTAVPSFATTITPQPPGWVQIDFTITVIQPGAAWEFGGVTPGVYAGYLRWDLNWWNPATDESVWGDGEGHFICPSNEPDADSRDHYACFQYGVIGFENVDGGGFGGYDTLESIGLSRYGLGARWDMDNYFGNFSLNGDFKQRRITGGRIRIADPRSWPGDETKISIAVINPHPVPEPSTLMALIAGCLALAMGHRIYNR